MVYVDHVIMRRSWTIHKFETETHDDSYVVFDVSLESNGFRWISRHSYYVSDYPQLKDFTKKNEMQRQIAYISILSKQMRSG